MDSSQLCSFEHWEPVSATDNPKQLCYPYNLHEPIRVSRFVRLLETADLYSSSSLSTSPISSIQLDAPPDAKEVKLGVLYYLLASVGQYTLVIIQTSKQEGAWSRSASSATRAATKYLQCTQCSMRVPLSELSRFSALNPITHTAEILSKLSAQHDAECTSRLAINRYRSDEARTPIEEGQLESSQQSIGTNLNGNFCHFFK